MKIQRRPFFRLVFINIVLLACTGFFIALPRSKPQMYFMALFVRNIDSSVAWYSKVYTLKQRNRTDNVQRGFKQVNLVGDNMFVELIELSKGVDKTDLLKNAAGGTMINGFFKTGFLVDNIEMTLAELRSLHVKVNGNGIFTDPVNNKKQFQVLDPDGNILQYFEK